MKPLTLLIVGVVVGWAASGVNWSRDAVGQDALTDVAPSTLQETVPDAPPQPATRAVPTELGREANPRKADGILDESIPRPRRVYETRVTVDSNGARHTELMSRLVNADGSIVPATPPGLVGRFQASAYGSPNGHGCYVVDTMTGQTWHILNGQPPQVVAAGLTPYAPQPAMPTPAANYSAPPLMNRSTLTPEAELTEPTPERRDVDSPPLNTPVPELAEPTPDAAE